MSINGGSLPEPNTDQMVTVLHEIIEAAMDQAQERMQFTTGDLMGAVLYLVVEAGLQNAPPEQLKKDIASAVERIIGDQKKGLN